MACNRAVSLLSAVRRAQPARLPRLKAVPSPSTQRWHPAYSTTTEDTPPPFLQRLKGDLKTAMRARDAPRLSVLRSIISANLNASKTANPVRTDVQLVALMRRIQKNALDAAADAKAAGRQDIVEKENVQIRILDEYLAGSGIQTLGEVELKALIQEAVDASKGAGTATRSLIGDVMKRLSSALEGKDVDKKAVADMVKELAGR
ncbi:Aspartyl/glutamyl-tRNA amidotransferase subunit B-related protein [Metarhizium album ARSEF 1941]|uniref:Altered inheritance of mitochondria protein 41 n=1 Tax=Metarhizium album (strain ARSEF 1941) TaxID=1081103 RepID=A0A0B2X6W1_METAS|nr:Aspartyl/glutamyl-tRNA amidotransferase subunit B-related protein [Metarhizium album ARSEF 1941]KHO02134.1 Aspartyl/glutamyl-tRNA amidotransferase subunit B-related protein [Metarhizium album ARSEF 1941]